VQKVSHIIEAQLNALPGKGGGQYKRREETGCDIQESEEHPLVISHFIPRRAAEANEMIGSDDIRL